MFKMRLYRMRLFGRAEAFKRNDVLVGVECGQRRDAGAYRRAIDMDRASAALAESAAEPRAAQFKIVTQSVEERHVGIVYPDNNRFAVNVE
jgi:hypothetical protein